MSDVFSTNCTGDIGAVRYVYKWVIEDFSQHCKDAVGEFITSSPYVMMIDGERSKFHLQCYPYGKDSKSRDYISLYMKFYEDLSLQKKNVHLDFYTTSTPKGKNVKRVQSSKKIALCGISKFLDRKSFNTETMDFLHHDTLTVFCDIIFDVESQQMIKGENTREIIQEDFRKTEGLDNLESLLKSGKYSDVTFMVKGQHFPLHKNIMASQSVEFERIFQNFEPHTLSVYEIGDIDPKVFRELVRYMYARRIKNINDLADGLLVAAHRYSLDTLIEICEENLFGRLCTQNAMKYLRLADDQNQQQMKDRVIRFMVAHFQDTVEVPEFDDIVGNLTHQTICELFKALAPRMRRSMN